MYTARFGPAGNSDAFYESGRKATADAPAWLESMGLNAFEYQCGRGVQVGEETARLLAVKSQQHNVQVSVHAPYYISLASEDPVKRENSLRYILDSARAVTWMGGSRIVVHPGGLGGLPRAESALLAVDTLTRAQALLDEQGFSHIHICPETMGKLNQLGDLDEVLLFCMADERFLPCVDFGHLNSRTGGGVNSPEAFAAVLDRIADRLGEERAREMHMHFSKIEYTTAGEKRHLTFEDTEYGPEPAPLMALLAARHWTPTVICESRGTQDSDARVLKVLYDSMLATN